MNEEFFNAIYEHLLIAKSALKEIIAAHQKINFAKGSIILESGKIANNYFIIETELLRAYVNNYEGNEITTDFFCDGELSIEVSSLFQRIPSQENIRAITDGTAWRIEFDTFQLLFHSIEGYREWGRVWMSHQLFISKQRRIEMLTKSAPDRYLELLKKVLK
jgi:CRP-like cAMP-binding protein